MATDIKDVDFQKPFRQAPDYIFNEVDLEDTDVFDGGEAESDEIFPGNTQNGVSIVVEVDEEVETLASTGALEVEYLYGDSFADSVTILSVGDDEALSPGELIRFTPSAGWYDSPAKIKITATDATGVISVFPIRIS